MNAPPPANDPARLTRAHVVPFAVFVGFLFLLQIANATIAWDHPDAPWWRQDPAHWIYPVQTLAGLALLLKYWRSYDFRPSRRWNLLGAVFGIIGIAAWLLPTTLYDYWQFSAPPGGWLELWGVAPRTDGFNPNVFDHPAAWTTAVAFRFLRAVVVVAFVEEIFWRGFLMRFVCDWDGNYWNQPFGRPAWRSYLIVTVLFVAVHSPPDRPAAFLYGSLTYLLCVWSKSLAACITMHATANAAMAVYIMVFHKYGLW